MHSLLRRGVTTAVSKILGTNQALRGNNIIGLPSTQIRSSSVFKINIFESFAQYRKVSKLKSLVDQDPTEENTLEYVKALCKVEPKEAAALIERGWTNNKLPINENFVREYLKAAAAINGLDKVNVGALLHMIRVHGNDKGSATLQAGFTGGLSNIMKGTKDEPMHVISRVETTFKDHLIAIVKTVLLGCIIFAFAGAVLDDRGENIRCISVMVISFSILQESLAGLAVGLDKVLQCIWLRTAIKPSKTSLESTKRNKR